MDLELLQQMFRNPTVSDGTRYPKFGPNTWDKMAPLLQDTALGRLGEDIGYGVGKVGQYAGRAISDASEALTPDILIDYLTHLDTGIPTERISALRSKNGSGPFSEPVRSGPMRRSESEVPSEPEEELDLSDPAVLAAITSGKRRVGPKSKLKSSRGSFSRTGSGMKSPTNPEIVKLMYQAATEREKSQNTLRGNLARAYAAAGAPYEEVGELAGMEPKLERVLEFLKSKGYTVTPPSE